MATTDLPFDIRTGLPRYELSDPLEHLQTLLNEQNIDIESLDRRGLNEGIVSGGFEPHQLRAITALVDNDPTQGINSATVRNLNDTFDKDLETSNPNYIFRKDITTVNNRNLIREGNLQYSRERDFFVVPPAVDTNQQILDLLREKSK